MLLLMLPVAKTEHVALSLDKEALAWARAEAKARGASLSALMSELLQRNQRLSAWKSWLADNLDKPLTPAEIAAAARELAAHDQLADRASKNTAKPRRRKAVAKRKSASLPKTRFRIKRKTPHAKVA
jgi:hypothetical protein